MTYQSARMGDVRTLAAAYGIRIEIVPLGEWGSVRLLAEYDPDGPVIRVNARTLPPGAEAARAAVDRAVAHELYHHREAIGAVARIGSRGAREAAAEAFAQRLTAIPA